MKSFGSGNVLNDTTRKSVERHQSLNREEKKTLTNHNVLITRFHDYIMTNQQS